MRNAFEAVTHAADENLAAPNGAVIAVTRAVETDADDALVPGTALGEHGSDVSAMMLHGNLFDCGKFGGVDRRHILRMRIVNERASRSNRFHTSKANPGSFREKRRTIRSGPGLRCAG